MPIIIGKPPSQSSSGGGTDQSAEIAAIQAKDQSQDTLISEASDKNIEQDERLDAVEQTASGISSLGQRVTTLENAPAATDYSPAITAVQEKNTAQDTRLASIDAALLNKAPLVSGKVPYENLPEFPVGRKVNVADKAARLLLSPYADLTIAYESDTGDAWGLDSNDDPSIEANWSKLGNAQGVGVASFNGRTGNIGPLNGDYITNQISETLTKQFVTPEQKTEWTAKETTTGAQTKATTAQTAATLAAKTYADATFIPLSQKGVNSGLATLGTDGKVPASQLPNSQVVTPRIWRDALSSRSYETWITNTSNNEMQVYFRSTPNNNISRQLQGYVRADSGSTSLVFRSDAQDATGNKQLTMNLTVPVGWQYLVLLVGGTGLDKTGITSWFELS